MHSGYEICSIIFVAATGYHHQNKTKSTKLAKVVKKIVKKVVKNWSKSCQKVVKSWQTSWLKNCQKVVKIFATPGKNQK
jgi:hypothetical protein